MQGNGAFKQADYYDNTGGLNISDSPFKIKDECATNGSLNYNYSQTGGVTKRLGHDKVNSIADSSLKTIGLGLNNSALGVKSVIRAADTHLQLLDVSTPSFTNLTEDIASANSTFLTAGSTQPVVFSQFNTATNNILWAAGGGMTIPYGIYSNTKASKNGSQTPGGSISATPSLTGGTFAATGTYFYAVARHKLGTGALSNAALDTSATIANTTDIVTINLTGITGTDTNRDDLYYIYRSAVGGVTSFTTGDLIAQVSAASTSYVDTGTYITTAANIPRAGNTILDNSALPAATYNAMTVWKRRLIVAAGSTVYLSDLNKPESFPLSNVLTIPTGGNITGLAIISLTSVASNGIDELLVIFKDREIWVITGTSVSDWALKFIDNTGCGSQPLAVNANGYLAWIDYRGVYLWDGTGKPIYCSKPIEPLFDKNGDLNKTLLSQASGQFFRKENTIIWFLSHKVFGDQRFQLKMDLRLTLPSVEASLMTRMMDGVFIYDKTTFPIYAALSYLPSSYSDESLLLGDSSGFIYKAFNAYADAGLDYSFTYGTKFLDMGNPNQEKRFNYVVVWVEELGTWDLNLDFWTDYASSSGTRSTRALPLSTRSNNAAALWDVAFWDVAFWDDYDTRPKALIFQLASDTMNNSEGKCLRLQFRQETANQPVSILGYSVLYTDKSFNQGAA